MPGFSHLIAALLATLKRKKGTNYELGVVELRRVALRLKEVTFVLLRRQLHERVKKFFLSFFILHIYYTILPHFCQLLEDLIFLNQVPSGNNCEKFGVKSFKSHKKLFDEYKLSEEKLCAKFHAIFEE